MGRAKHGGKQDDGTLSTKLSALLCGASHEDCDLRTNYVDSLPFVTVLCGPLCISWSDMKRAAERPSASQPTPHFLLKGRVNKEDEI